MNKKFLTYIIILIAVLFIAVPAFSSQELSVSSGWKKFADSMGLMHLNWKQILVMGIGVFLIILAITKGYEPLLLIPIGMGAILTNIPVLGVMNEGGFIRMIYDVGIESRVFPLIIFLGVGALTDFGPLLANPRTFFLGAAAQFGIFTTLLGALLLKYVSPALDFTLKQACSIGIIGGADGPTAIYTTSKLAPDLLGPIAIAAYSYMALVPIIQPPIMRLFTSKRERRIKMEQLKPVSKRVKILFPISIIILTSLFIPEAVPLVGMLMFGNLLRESGVTERLAKAAQNEIINITTIFLGICVGAKMEAAKFLTAKTLAIIALGLLAFAVGTMTGVIFAKIMNYFSKKHPINPLIGAAGVSAVPMAARVAQKVGQDENPQNYLLMHAMGPNVAGVIGSAIAAGIMLALVS